MKLKTPGKIAVLLVVAGVAIGGYQFATQGKGLGSLVPEGKTSSSSVPPKADLGDLNRPGTGASTADMQIPGSRVAGGDQSIRILIWAWNAHLGALFANGGPQTTEGSLIAKEGLKVGFSRQDDPAKMQEELVTFATELSRGNANPTIGAHFVTIMGDGGAAFLEGVNTPLRKLGPEYQAKVVAILGYSRGEDKFMGPQNWKDNPALSKGGVVSGYLRDGDWNIALKWLGDNGLKNNPDEKTYDPDALNWVSANDYIDAAEKYIAGYSEERPVVRNGRRTGETKRITVQGVVTWTPGDVTIAREKGGLVSIVSTKEYSSQMPCVVIGIDKWMKNNRPKVESMIEAFLRGGDAVKSSDTALEHAAKIADATFNEDNTGPDYWVKYYRGVTETDKQGLEVELGGSSVNNLADTLYSFGLLPGSRNLFEATYTVFGNIVKQQYPDMMASFAPASQITDLSYVKAIASRSGPTSTAIREAAPKPVDAKTNPKVSKAPVISERNWSITFQSGRANFSPQASATLSKLLQDLLVAGNTIIEVHGHTDNVGNAQANMQLSEARAFAVKNWLENRARTNFPQGKIRVFAHGQTNPVAPNSTEAGRSKNRRVVIILRAMN